MPDDTRRFAARAEGGAVVLVLDLPVPDIPAQVRAGLRVTHEAVLDPATARAIANDLLVAADAADPSPPNTH